MARDVRQFGDAQIEYWLQQPGISPELRDELMAEKARRSSAPPNVDANLEAAASPIAMEPTVGAPKRRRATAEELMRGHFNRNNPDGPAPLGMGDVADDIEAYSAAYADALAEERQQSYARADARVASGYKDPRQEAYNAEAGVLPAEEAAEPIVAKPFVTAEDVANASDEELAAQLERTGPQSALGGPMMPATPEGVRAHRRWMEMVNANPGSHMQAVYNPAGSRAFLDEQRAQTMAAANAEIEKYGPSAAQATPAQAANRQARITEEDRRRAQQVDMIIDRIARNTGQPRAVIATSLGIGEDGKPADKTALSDGMLTMEEVRNATRKYQYAARDRRDQELEARRAMIRERGMLFGSNQRLNAANQFMAMPDDWQNFVRAGGRGATPLDVEGRQLDQATRLAGQAVMGAIAGGAGNDTALKVREDQRMQELRGLAGKAKNDAWGDDTAAALKALERAGATAAQKEAIMTELFGPGWQDAMPARPRATGQQSTGPGGLPAPPGSTPYRYGA